MYMCKLVLKQHATCGRAASGTAAWAAHMSTISSRRASDWNSARRGHVRSLFRKRSLSADFTHVVIGGGVVGLAIAQSLARWSISTAAFPPSVLLLERHSAVGTETSSRNSEVVHAGIYYGANSLKAQLCVRGRDMLHRLCKTANLPISCIGKWIVAGTPAQRDALQRIHDLCAPGGGGLPSPGAIVRWVGRDEAARREPEVHAPEGVLESLSTAIIDSHALMTCLLGRFEEAGGTVALRTAVTGVKPLGGDGSSGWELSVRDAQSEMEMTLVADTIINSAGLGAVDIHNMILPADSPRRRRMYYAKGNYFAYAPAHPRVGTLIYPAPEPSAAGAAGLGTHLTLDMAGNARFGPDVEWVDSPANLAVNASRLAETAAQVKRYLPALDATGLRSDYAGIRPKLAPQGAVAQGQGFEDFYIREEEGYKGWINLLGIESPGLTSCLAIAGMVKNILYA